MKKFSFSLDKVLSYKMQIERNLRSEHAHILHLVAQKEEEIRQLELKFKECCAQFEAEKKNGSSSGRLKIFENYLQSLNAEIRRE